MLISDENISLYVLIDCVSFSEHRNPKGLYKVNVLKEESFEQSVRAASEVVWNDVPFMDENTNTATLRVFSLEGNEIVILPCKEAEYSCMGVIEEKIECIPDSLCFD